MDKISLGAINCAYPLVSFLVGTYDSNEQPNIMLVAWGGICCSTPPCINVSIRPQRHTHAAIESRKAFTISIPSAAQVAQADFAGIVSGKNHRKFEECGLTPVRSTLVDAPYVDECHVVIELKLKQAVPLGSHSMFIGEVVDVKANPAIITEDRTPDFLKMQALIYAPGSQYHVPGSRLAGNAFSIGKQLIK